MPESRIAEHVQTKEPELMQDLIPLLRRKAKLEAYEQR